MGEAHSISIQQDPTPAEAPNAPEVEATPIPHGVYISTEPSDGESEVSSGVSERPEWLPEKFADVEEMAKAYQSLEKKQGGSEEPAKTDAPPSGGLGADTLQPFYDEYASSGELTEESFVALEEMGLARDLVASFMKGQQATHQAELNQIYDAVGGQESYAKALEWANTNLSATEVKAYNDQVEAGDLGTAQIAAQGLMARFHQATNSTAPQMRLQSEPTGDAGPAGYESIAQVMEDMKSDSYKKDPAFRAKVQAKIERSNVM